MAGCTMRSDQLAELLSQIGNKHQAYLFEEKNTSKIKKKEQLEAYIHQFLCRAPHKLKFFTRATGEVLHRSVQSKDDFTAYRATGAWTAIANYAENLLTQPWRKEYHEIKTYCGYYKHHVGSGLVGAELMLEEMGYKNISQSTLVLDGPVDLQKVTMISLDSLIALVECQILGNIHARVLKSVQSCSWTDVLMFREQEVCSPEDAIRVLSHRLHQRMHEPYRPHLDNYSIMPGYSAPYPYPYMPPSYCNYGYAQPGYVGIMSPSHQYPPCFMKPHDQYTTSYAGYHHPHPTLKNGYPPPCSVPTAQLIEFGPIDPVNTHRRSSSDHRIDTTDYRNNGDRYQSDMYSRSTTSDDISSKRGGNKFVAEDWRFLHKDSGDRRERERIPQPLELEDAIKGFSLDDRHGITLSDRKSSKTREYEDKKDEQLGNNRISVYDNAPLLQSISTKQQSVQTMARDKKPSENSVHNSNKLTSADARKLRVNLNNEDRASSRGNEDEWDCKACTYHNKSTVIVCEMCSKSRYASSEQKPLASGGRECENCTLINEKGVVKCKACERNLKDSAIYI